MADVNANIGVNIDTSNALAQLKALQRQISQFHTSISKSSEAASLAQRDLQRNFINSVNSIGTFSAELRTVKTTAESFTDSLEKNKFSMREYFRYAGGATKTFGRLFKSEFDTVNKVAEENVKRLQTQYIKMGRDASGAMRAIAIIPNELDMSSMSTQLQMSAQRQAIFNQLLKQGSTNLLNFGKNTQWAGRQLMVGFTLPLASLGAIASKTFMDMETAALKFRKVYGDLFTPAAEREKALDDVMALGESFTKYGIAVSQTVNLAAEAAAAGFQGLDLQRQVTEATRLQVLGQVDQQKALETTISLQNAFQLSSADLADSINFLNAVENQTVVSLDDITTAIPKAAPVVKQLGGDVRDLAFFMAAMKEGGINASEGANALKSGLASLINPTDKATAMMKSFGIDIDAIVNKNAGNVKQTVIEFAQALDGLSDLNRQRAIEQLFGKFQLARLSTLFENVTKEGNQASRVLDLATASAGDLASMAESELGMTADSAMNKFRKSVEDLKLALVPVGQTFLESMTPIIEFVGGILEKFNDLPKGVKKAITVITVALGAIGPVALMTFGLLANGLANAIKFVAILRNGYLRLTGQSQVLGEQTQYLTIEQQNALAVAHSLDQSHAKLIQTFNAESGAVQRLSQAYERAIAAGANFARINPGMMAPPRKYANGVQIVPGSGNRDTVPAMLTPGEAVIPKDMTKKYGALINGMIAGNIPGYNDGLSYEGQSYSIPVSSRTTQSAVENVLSRFSKDVEGISLALEFLQERAKELGAEFGQVNADQLKKMLDELGVARNRKKGQSSSGGYVFAHAQAPGEDITDSAEIERLVNLANTTEQGVGRFLNATLETMNAGEQAAIILAKAQQEEVLAQQQLINATTDADKQAAQAKILAAKEAQALAQKIIEESQKARAYTLSNFGFVLPEGANKGEFSPAKVAEQFTGENISRTMAPVYSQYARQLGMTLEEALNNPQIAAQMHQDINEFASRIALEIGDATDGFLTDPAFYSAVERARTGLGDAVSSILISAIDEMKKTSTVVTFGGQANRGTTGQRTGLALAESQLRENFGAASGPSYRDIGTSTFIKQGELVGQSTVQGVALGAGTQSPSKKTIPIGEDIARGLEVGMANRQDDVALSGENLASAAVAGTKRGYSKASSPGGTVGAGGVIIPPVVPPVAGGVAGGADGGNGGGAGVAAATNNLAKFNSALMGVSFAMTGVSGIASAFGGRFQGLSEVIFKVSGLMFGLMSVVQLLTQEMFASVIASRANKMAMLANTGATGFKGLFTGVSGFGSRLLVATKFLIRFIGPVGAVIAGLSLTASIIKKVNSEREKERKRIEAFSDVLQTTTDQMSFLGDYFDFIPQKTPLELFDDLEQVSVSVRNAREQLKADERFQKEFGTTIEQVRGMKPEQAQTALQLKGVELISKGMSKEAVQTLIDSIKEEAGKTTLKFNFKDIEFTTPSLEGLGALASESLDDFENKFKSTFDRINKIVRDSAFSVGVSEEKIRESVNKMVTEELSSEIKNASAGIASFVKSLSGLVKSGQIDTATFKQAFDSMVGSIKANVKDAGAQLVILQGVLTATNPRLAKLTTGIQDVDKMAAVLAATSAGVSRDLIKFAIAVFTLNDAIIANRNARIAAGLAADATADDAKKYADSMDATNRTLDLLNSEGDKSIELFKKLNQSINDGDPNGEKSVFQKAIEQLQQQKKELANTNTAYNRLKAAGVETSRAFEIASDPILAAAIATTKVGTEKWYELLDILDKVNAALAKEELKKFFETRTEQDQLFKSFMNIVPKLKELGLGAEEMRAILSDPKIAKEFIKDLKDGALDSKRLKTYIEQIPTEKNVNIIIDMETKTIEEKFEEAFRKAMEYFDNEIAKKKIELEISLDIKGKKEAVDAAQKAVDDIQNGVFDAQGNLIKEGIDQVNRALTLARRDIELNFDRPMEALQEEISDLQRQMEITIERPIENLNKEIAKLERSIEEQFNRPIAALQEESSDLANDLTLIDKAAEAVNEKYDAQEKALQKISDINQEILNQDKSRLSVADALSRGDIAAAAQAAQEARAQAAQAAAQRAGGVLQAAREAEIGGLRGAVSGLTRKQIEQRQFDIGQQIFALEERRDIVQAQIQTKQDEIFRLEQLKLPILDKIREKEDLIYALQEKKEQFLLNTIRPLEDRLWQLENVDLYNANEKLKKAQKALQDAENTINQEVEKINKQKEAWEKAKVAIEAAKLEAEGIKKAVEGTTSELVNVAAGWAAVEAAAKKAAEAMAGNKPKVPVVSNPYGGSDADYDRKIGFNRTGSISAGQGIFAGKMYGGKVKKMAMGGIVGGSGMTDKVPTMLTPGEFVVNKQATRRFGPLLSAINGTKYPQMLAKGGMVKGSGSPSMSMGSPRTMAYGGMVGKPSMSVAPSSFSKPSFGSLRNYLSSPSYNVNSRSMPPINKSDSAVSISDNSNTVYNYNVGITLSGTNMNPNTVAKAVMDEIRYVDSQRIRTQRA